MRKLQVGVDIGGTFTDLVLIDPSDGAIHIGKILSTPDDSATAVIDALQDLMGRLDLQGEDLGRCVHATTLVINALIERRGAKVGMITTRGFGDVLSIGTEQRYDIYDLYLQFPDPLVPRTHIREVAERSLADGTITVPLDQDELERALNELLDIGIESLAICFLHAYRNSTHELEAAAIAERISSDLPISVSHQVVAEIREYERTSTTVANAYVRPLAEKYLYSLRDKLRELGYHDSPFVMFSSGGVGTVETAAQFPIRMVESGPAAGALAAAFHARELHLERVLAFDMGGTTAKLSTIVDGKATLATGLEVDRVHRFKKGSGIPLRVPVIDLIEIGTGGGSIAILDQTGLLQVGPRSSGAEPGPACYGRGGTEPTVTDANLVLGYLDPNAFLGGEMPLDTAAATEAIKCKIAEPLQLGLIQAAWGIHEVANENMANAARVHLAESGGDPRKFTLMAFGGAGPAHARRLAHKLGIRQIVYPAGAGVMSAFGLLVTPISFDFSHSYMTRLDQVEWPYVGDIYSQMEERATSILTDAGVPLTDISFSRTVDARYYGQEHEVSVPLPDERLTEKSIEAIVANFDEVFTNKYYWVNSGAPLELVNWRLHATAPPPVASETVKTSSGSTSAVNSLMGTRTVWYGASETIEACPVHDRYLLRPGTTLLGPAIIEERETTIVVGTDERVTVDSALNLLLEVSEKE